MFFFAFVGAGASLKHPRLITPDRCLPDADDVSQQLEPRAPDRNGMMEWYHTNDSENLTPPTG